MGQVCHMYARKIRRENGHNTKLRIANPIATVPFLQVHRGGSSAEVRIGFRNVGICDSN